MMSTTTAVADHQIALFRKDSSASVALFHIQRHLQPVAAPVLYYPLPRVIQNPRLRQRQRNRQVDSHRTAGRTPLSPPHSTMQRITLIRLGNHSRRKPTMA
jgi:hypothetical protein